MLSIATSNETNVYLGHPTYGSETRNKQPANGTQIQTEYVNIFIQCKAQHHNASLPAVASADIRAVFVTR